MLPMTIFLQEPSPLLEQRGERKYLILQITPFFSKPHNIRPLNLWFATRSMFNFLDDRKATLPTETKRKPTLSLPYLFHCGVPLRHCPMRPMAVQRLSKRIVHNHYLETGLSYVVNHAAGQIVTTSGTKAAVLRPSSCFPPQHPLMLQ